MPTIKYSVLKSVFIVAWRSYQRLSITKKSVIDATFSSDSMTGFKGHTKHTQYQVAGTKYQVSPGGGRDPQKTTMTSSASPRKGSLSAKRCSQRRRTSAHELIDSDLDGNAPQCKCQCSERLEITKAPITHCRACRSTPVVINIIQLRTQCHRLIYRKRQRPLPFTIIHQSSLEQRLQHCI